MQKDKFLNKRTHRDYQEQEESVKVIGDGFDDAYMPKTPNTDKHSQVQPK